MGAIIGHVASTHEYKSRVKMKDGEYQKKRHRDEEAQKEPKEIDKVMDFEMKLKRVYIKNKQWGGDQIVWGCEECPWGNT